MNVGEKKIKGAGILLVMSKALFLLPCTFMFIVLCYFKRRKKWCWIDVLLFLPFSRLFIFLKKYGMIWHVILLFFLVIHWGL
ncbi:hypothetical protein CU026_0348 [Enterococcus faecium]|nr:hypothetical protein [Enterococcus faecium]